VVSGKDAQARVVSALLKSLGFPRLAVADHAELKMAGHLRQAWERTGKAEHVTVVVNNRVCAGPLSCAELLPVMLPAGCSLLFMRRTIGAHSLEVPSNEPADVVVLTRPDGW
jgi:hypothetical protein